ncbi:MAG: thiamine pyrophosphate-dependent enzyme [Gammaproteobacteria bacterium]|nr:thiamine pyrophosphate-dependent enzyme [Gammaproteobacteria bacterium]
MEQKKIDIIKKIIWLRLAQIFVNQRYKKGDFLVPIHLAMGHETIAVAVDEAMGKQDSLFLTHRNIHYNLVKMGTLKEELDEYYLKSDGLAQGHLGSMNLSNPDKNINYTSSILGNNLPVGCGFALANKVKNINGVVIIVTGDGAIEEGSFYESLLFLKSNNLPSIVLVENNEWSLATRINERRANIDFSKLANSLGIEYLSLQENDPFEYKDKISLIRANALEMNSPVLVEVKLTTLGYWYMQSEEHPGGKFINYHGGPAPEVDEKEYPQLVSSNEDPLFPLNNYLSEDELIDISNELSEQLKEEIS